MPSWAPHGGPSDAAVTTVGAVLRGLEPAGWTALHDLYRPGRSPTGIDHVAVGPGGVVVVDVRSSDASGSDAADAAATITALLAPRHRTAVRAVVCLTDRVPPHAGTAGADAAPGATVVTPDGLAAHLRGLAPRLRPADVSGLAQLLSLHLGVAHGTGALTTAALDAPRSPRRRAVRPSAAGPLPAPRPAPEQSPAGTEPELSRHGPVGLALRTGVVVCVAWLGWVFTTTPLGLL